MATSVRFATDRDVPDLVELGRRMHAESPRYAKFPYARDKAEAVARSMLASPIGVVIVAEDHGQVIGMVVGFVAEHFFSAAKYSCDYVLFVAQPYRGGSAAVRLINAWEKRAKELGAVECQPGVSTEVDVARTKGLYEKLGYRLSGYIMLKDL